MKKVLLLLAAFVVFQNAAAQDHRDNQTRTKETPPAEEELIDIDAYFIDHTTKMGERILMISKKYMVDPDEIYKYNVVESDRNGLMPGQVLKIPLHKSHKKDIEKFKKELIKKNGGNPIQVPSIPPIKKKEEEGEEDE